MDSSKSASLDPRFLDCIHCGLCLSSCPTFTILGTEADSPRGRIYLMRALAEGRAEPTDALLGHLDSCLGCRACETACPSGVRYGELLEETRAATEPLRKRSWRERLSRTLLLETLTQPDRLAMAMGPASYLGGKEPKVPGFMVGLLTGKPSEGMVLPSRPKMIRKPYPAVMKPEGKPQMKVGLLTGCVMSVLFSRENDATVRCLLRNGVEIHTPGDQGCCGALHAHYGERDTAKEMARHNLDVFKNANVDRIVVNSAGCGSLMKEYSHLLHDDPNYAALAKEFGAKVRDISEVLMELPKRSPFQETPVRATYHDACHLAHGQGVRNPPRALLQSIPGLELVTLPESDWCCGSAGIYNFVQPELAGSLLDRKVENIERTGAQWLVTGNPGCFMWIANGLHAKGSAIEVMHTVEALDRAWGGEATCAIPDA